MTYRKFDTHTWQDPWFEELSPKAKLLFIYLWTNETCNQAGVYKISKKRMDFELGFDVSEFMAEISGKVFWDKERQIVWVKKFLTWQCQNKSFLSGALTQVQAMPQDILGAFLDYNHELLKKHELDTMSTQCPDCDNTTPSSEQNRTETETEQNREEKDTVLSADFSEAEKKIPLQDIASFWNQSLSSRDSPLPKLTKITPNTQRYKHVRARWKENPDFKTWQTAMQKVAESDFLNGRVKEFQASFDWLVKSQDNFNKVLEGNYDNREKTQNQKSLVMQAY